MNLKIEILEPDIKKLLAAALTQQTGRTVAPGDVVLNCYPKEDMRGEVYGHEVRASATLPLKDPAVWTPRNQS